MRARFKTRLRAFSSKRIMGRLANSRVVSAFAIGGTAIVLSLNVLLLVRMWMPE
jgi:Mn2+/Fe2+ NRAMP family transporter